MIMRLFCLKTDASLVPVFICPRREVVIKQQQQHSEAPRLQYRRLLGTVFKV